MPVPILSIFGGEYEKQVAQGAQMLAEGGIVVVPTETVYGAAALLTHAAARRRLAELRPGGGPRPCTIHLAMPAGAHAYLDPVDEYGERLIRKLWPGPVSLHFSVSPQRRQQVAGQLKLPESEIYADGGITLRCPDHIVASDVIAGAGGPVVVTAAGSASGPTWRAEQLAEELEGRADLIFDAGPTKYAKPSTILNVLNGRYEIARAGVYDERIIERLLRTTVLFVCSGNTCRSPMSEAIARRVLSEKLGVPEPELEKKGISVISAGSFALPGARATPQAVQALKEIGIDLTHHRSKPLTIELIHQSDMVFTMSRNHAQAVVSLVPSASEKVATLDPAGDIDDPIGGDVRLYQDLAGQLRKLIEKRLDETVLRR